LLNQQPEPMHGDALFVLRGTTNTPPQQPDPRRLGFLGLLSSD
jgi:hypothetical protein